MMDESKIIQRFNWQRVIGYSNDFKRTFYQGEAVYSDGSVGTVYSEDLQYDRGFIWIGDWSPVRPHVDRVAEPSQHAKVYALHKESTK